MKTWLITGASSGLGLQMTRVLLERGDRVVATARRTEPFEDLKQAHGDRLRVARFDITDTPALRSAVDEAFAACGRIDVVVSNAGYGLFGAAEEVSDAQIERQLATNLTGSIQLVRAVLPHLRAQGGGRILQVSSEGGQVAYPNFSLYHASKWGIEGFLEAVAQEVLPFGIEVLIAEPGPTATGFAAGLDHGTVMDVYDATPAGDAERTVAAMITYAEEATPRRRLALGSAAFENIERSLRARMEDLQVGRDVAYSADRSAVPLFDI